MTERLCYTNLEMPDYYANHRRRFTDLYTSEQAAFAVAAGSDGDLGRVLDAGCAMGGLCFALAERYHLADYTGVDIHAGLVQAATKQDFPVPTRILCGDMQELKLPEKAFETVVSLSCVDWNLEPRQGLAACWRLVRPGGRLVLTLRLTPGSTCDDPAESFQYIHYGLVLPKDPSHLERAPYVVFNAVEALTLLRGLSPQPGDIYAHGYWGSPSPTARTPHDRLVFAALVVSKTPAPYSRTPLRGELPDDLLTARSPDEAVSPST